MTTPTITDPIINSPFEAPSLHWELGGGVSPEIVAKRRISAYFSPVPQPQIGQQLGLVAERPQENRLINTIRAAVDEWRAAGYPGASLVSRELLAYWEDPNREFRLFFCQIEAARTAIYLAEAAGNRAMNLRKKNSLAELEKAAKDYNADLFRVAFKIATGGGKTTVMAMLIAWQTLNKADNPRADFSDKFLIVAPGITIKERLRVLRPEAPDNIYSAMDLIPRARRERLNRAKIVIVNFHAFLHREKTRMSAAAKELSGLAATGANTETPAECAARVCRDFRGARDIIVINDEAHHCYRPLAKDAPAREKLAAEERAEMKEEQKNARVWISGLDAVRDTFGIRQIYDLSATPFFLRGSGVPEGTLFPWTVSDFSLVDAIESGIVKIPRVPVEDDSAGVDGPVYRKIWPHIADGLPAQGRGNADELAGQPALPDKLYGALDSLYSDYKKTHERWANDKEAQARGATAPVFIVVCKNTSISYLVYRYIAGWEKTTDQGAVLVAGKLPLFNNVENGKWRVRPPTILMDSRELESEDAMSAEFKEAAAAEISMFKRDLKIREGAARAEAIKDADLLREVVNTVGKKDKLGEHIKCVVSVSMLTEGWDANTVTHILGVRPFGTQLLCEQVVGRGLRRRNYETLVDKEVTCGGEKRRIKTFPPESAEIFGVPFSPFIPTQAADAPPPPAVKTSVYALPERDKCEIRFPRVLGFRYHFSAERLAPKFTSESEMTLTAADTPLVTINKPIIGESTTIALEELQTYRVQQVVFQIARETTAKYFCDGASREMEAWRFPQVLEITRRWVNECVHCGDNAFVQMLLMRERLQVAAEKIYQAILNGEKVAGRKTLLPVLPPYESEGSTRYIRFETARPTRETAPDKCHISHVVGDTKTWEQTASLKLEQMREVLCYVKNDRHLGFSIPFELAGKTRRYIPDFVVYARAKTQEPLRLIVEISGYRGEEKDAKAAAARTWTQAVNNDKRFGRWDFLEVTDIHKLGALVAAALRK